MARSGSKLSYPISLPRPNVAMSLSTCVESIRGTTGEGKIDVLLYNEHSENRLRITLPREAELTYADLLRIYAWQHRLGLNESVGRIAAPKHYAGVISQTAPLLLHTVRAMEKAMADAKPKEHPVAPRGPIVKGMEGSPSAMRWWLADFWLF